MGIPLWNSPPDPKSANKNSASVRCQEDRPNITRSSSSRQRVVFDESYLGTDRERQILRRALEREQTRPERRPAQTERLNYPTPPVPTTSTATTRSRPHVVQPSASDHLVTLNEFLRETTELRARRDLAEQHLQDLLRSRREDLRRQPRLTVPLPTTSTSSVVAVATRPEETDNFDSLVRQIRRIGIQQDEQLERRQPRRLPVSVEVYLNSLSRELEDLRRRRENLTEDPVEPTSAYPALSESRSSVIRRALRGAILPADAAPVPIPGTMTSEALRERAEARTRVRERLAAVSEVLAHQEAIQANAFRDLRERAEMQVRAVIARAEDDLDDLHLARRLLEDFDQEEEDYLNRLFPLPSSLTINELGQRATVTTFNLE